MRFALPLISVVYAPQFECLQIGQNTLSLSLSVLKANDGTPEPSLMCKEKSKLHAVVESECYLVK